MDAFKSKIRINDYIAYIIILFLRAANVPISAKEKFTKVPQFKK